MNHARRPDWRQWLAASWHPARKDGAIAVALIVLPWVIALVLWLLWLRRPHLDFGTSAAVIFGFAAVSVGLPVVWLAWVPIRNASRSSVSSAGDRAPDPAVLAGTSAGWPLAEVTDPFALEVHRPVQPEDPPPGLPELPTYVPREHDTALGSVVQAAAAGRSGIAVLVGGSSTGKTRACWEALQLLRDQPEPWRLWHPIDPTRPDAALRELPGIGPRTVVWLNEAQFYLDPPDGGLGERVAAGLRELLRDPDRAPVLVLATLWPRFWDILTARPPVGPDPHPHARELLAGHEIPVPAAFTPAQLGQLTRARDARLALAAAGAQDGQVIQFLAGAPELLARYHNAPPAAATLITAAMDARRLGMGIGLPQAFLAVAAPGYLTDTDWDALGEDWLDQALAYTAVPCKGARGPLTPIRPRPGSRSRPAGPGSPDGDDQPSAGQAGITGGPLYRLADYLDQHGRAHRKDQIPPAGFWAAAAAYASPGDQAALGAAAGARGLYRDAAQLHKNAAASGNLRAAHYLTRPPPWLQGNARPAAWAAAHVSLDSPSDVAELLADMNEAGAYEQAAALADRAAAHVPLDNPSGVAMLLAELRMAGAHEQAAALLRRDPAAHVPLDDPGVIAQLLESLLKSLREAGAQEQAAALAERAAAHVPLDNPSGVAMLLAELRMAGAHEQAAALLRRDPAAHVALDDPHRVAFLLGELRRASAREQAAALLRRDPAAHVALDVPYDVAVLLRELREAGAQDQFTALAERAAAQVALDNSGDVAMLLDAAGEAALAATALADRAAAHVALDNPGGVAMLLKSLRGAGAKEQATALADRAAAHVPLDGPWVIARLLENLRGAGAQEQATALADRAAAHVALDDPSGVAVLLGELRRAGAREQAATLLRRDPANRVPLDDPDGLSALLRELRRAGAQQQVTALEERAAAHVALDDPSGVAVLLGELREAGAREQVAALLRRDPANRVPLDDPGGVAKLLTSLQLLGADQQVTALLRRDPADLVSLENPDDVARLLGELREAGAREQAATLLRRLPAAGMFEIYLEQQGRADQFRFGRRADGSPSAPWGWEDLDLRSAPPSRRSAVPQ